MSPPPCASPQRTQTGICQVPALDAAEPTGRKRDWAMRSRGAAPPGQSSATFSNGTPGWSRKLPMAKRSAFGSLLCAASEATRSALVALPFACRRRYARMPFRKRSAPR